MNKPILSDVRTWRGYWWQPGKQSSAMPGTLTYRPDGGLTLELIGGWDANVMTQVRPGTFDVLGDEARQWPVLHGLSENREITLLDCLPTNTISRGFGPEQQTIHALTALSGVHLDAADQALFTQCDVAVEDLTMWSQSTILSGSLELEDGQINGTGTIVAKPVDDPSVTVNGVVTSLMHEHTLPHFDHARDSTVGRMQETRFVRFQPTVPWSLAAAQDQAKMVQDLLSLALHRPCGFLWMRLRMPPEERDYPEGYPVEDRKIDVYAKQVVPAEPSARAVEPRRALFTCEHLPFEEIWARWCMVRKNCLAASNLLLGLRYAPAGFIETQLLTATGAAEVLHRAIGQVDPPVPADEFLAMRAALLECAPDQHQAWVRQKLRNDVTLKDRLRDLARLPDQEAMERLVPDVERWATVTTQARNDLTHEGHTRRQSIDELIAAVKLTSAVVVMNLLQALDVPSERQREVIRDHPELRQTAKQAKDDLASEPAASESN